jgi:hypothetical protein
MRTRFPWYLLLQVEEALILNQEGRYDRAHRILDGLLARSTFHGDELRTVVRAKIDIYISQKNYEVAASWFELWEQFEVDPSRLEPYILLRLTKPGKKRARRKAQAKKSNPGKPQDAIKPPKSPSKPPRNDDPKQYTLW